MKNTTKGDCIPFQKLLITCCLFLLFPSTLSFPDFIANHLTLACSQWPSQHGQALSSPPPVVTVQTTVQTTELPSRSISSDDSTLRTRATTIPRPTWPSPTWIDMNSFPTGVASCHSVCSWALLFLTIFAALGGL